MLPKYATFRLSKMVSKFHGKCWTITVLVVYSNSSCFFDENSQSVVETILKMEMMRMLLSKEPLFPYKKSLNP